MIARLCWYLLLVATLAAVAGCGDEPYDDVVHESTTGPVCYQEPTWVFHADICPGKVDIGLCTWALTDGRTLHPDTCITQRGVTCVRDCKDIR